MRLLIFLWLDVASTLIVSDFQSENACFASEKAKILFDLEFPISIADLHGFLLGDTPWEQQLQDIVIATGHEVLTRRSSNFVVHNWYENKDGLRERIIEYQMHPNSTFVQTSDVRETQTYLDFSDESIVVKRLINNSGFMFSDAFFVEVFFCALKTSPTSTRMAVQAEIHSNSSLYFLVSGPVEDGTYAGLSEYYDGMRDTLMEWAFRQQENNHNTTDTADEPKVVQATEINTDRSVEQLNSADSMVENKPAHSLTDSKGTEWTQTGEGEIRVFNATVRAYITSVERTKWAQNRKTPRSLRGQPSSEESLIDNYSYFSQAKKINNDVFFPRMLAMILVFTVFVLIGLVRYRIHKRWNINQHQ